MSQPLEHRPICGFRTSFPCQLTAAREACVAVRSFLAEQGLGNEELAEWELILAEGINNAVSYVSDAKRDLPVEVEVSVADHDVTVSIHDHTEGFPWPATACLPEEEAEGGRGIYLIQSLTEFSDYRQGKHGNSLTLRRPCGKNRASEVGGSVGDNDGEAEGLRSSLTHLEGVLEAMTEELSSCYESLSAIFHFSSELGQSHHTEDFAKSLLNHVLEIAEADWFIFRQYFRDRERLVVLSASDERLRMDDLQVGDSRGGEGVELRVIESRQDEWLNPDDVLTSAEPLREVAQGCYVFVHPIFLNEALLGVLSVGRRQSAGALKAAQISFINTFAEFLAIQIVNAGYEQERISKGILTRELEIARNIQRSLLPAVLPEIAGFEFAASCESAREVGGDFYDVIPVAENCTLLVIADVMGKGIPAAFFASILRSLFRAAPERARNPAQLMTSVNQILYEDLSGVDMFITAQLVFVDGNKRLAKVANAGHCPALFSTSEQRDVLAVCPEGMPLGVLDDTRYEEGEVQLEAGSLAMIYTDGITEAANGEGEQFGDGSLRQWLLEQVEKKLPATDLKADLLGTIQRFQGSVAARDDMTFIIAAQRANHE